MPVTIEYADGKVHYRGVVVTHLGSTYQAKADTGRPPSHEEDWACLARAGSDAQMPQIKGTFVEGEHYRCLDIVATGGSAFMAKKNDPGACPGSGWQLIASCGRPGRPGQPGQPGQRGERGEPGRDADPAKSIVEWKIDRDKYRVIPVLSSGEFGKPIELRSLFEQFHSEAA